jgi:hypothetical protein
VVITLAFIGIGQNVSDELVQTVAYLSALGYGFACVIWLILGGSWFVHFMSVLRNASQD